MEPRWGVWGYEQRGYFILQMLPSAAIATIIGGRVRTGAAMLKAITAALERGWVRVSASVLAAVGGTRAERSDSRQAARPSLAAMRAAWCSACCATS